MAAAPIPLHPGDLARIAPARDCAYFLDVDGTLLDIAARPQDVAADASLRELLLRLSEAAGGALALISGRATTDIDRIFAPLMFPAAGLHGAEIRFPDGSQDVSALSLPRELHRLLAGFAAAHQGVWIENKGAALAVHFRQAPHLGGKTVEFLRQIAREHGLVVQEGKMVAELKDGGHDKGKAIAALSAKPPFASRKPVFAGDDLTDENGFFCVNTMGGISLRIGERDAQTSARYCLQRPKDFRAELEKVICDRRVGGHGC